eukprot:Hpha_TRINITY_DN9683_c0_g3::TRINITY_DN9683_c0_g3_i1::g.184426::m.184426
MGVLEAAESGDVDALNKCLSAGRDAAVSMRSKGGRLSALMIAAEGGHDECVGVLLKAGAGVSDRDVNGQTALHHAVAGGHDIAACELVRYGAKPAEADDEKRNVLHRAVEVGSPGALAVALLLLRPDDHPPGDDAGPAKVVTKGDILAALIATNARGDTPLVFAASEPDAEDFALQLIKVAKGVMSEAGLSAWLETQGECGTALHAACLQGNTTVAEAILRAGADPMATTTTGQTPLHCAVCSQALGVVDLLLEDTETEEYVNAKDNTGRAAVHLAALNGSLQILNSFTVREVTRMDDPDKGGKRAVELARERGFEDCVELLRNAGADVSNLPQASVRAGAPKKVQRESQRGKHLAPEPSGKQRGVSYYLGVIVIVALFWFFVTRG